MAIPIIGRGTSTTPTEERVHLPTPELSLPSPDQAPEAHRVLNVERLKALLTQESPILRGLAIDRISRLPERADLAPAVIPLVNDPNTSVAAAAARLLGVADCKAAVDVLLERFEKATGDLAGELAVAIGRLAPERLLEAVKKRGRLDDSAYVQTMATLARSELPDAIEYISKSMNRAGALVPERRAALYATAVLSGAPELCARVVGMALSESRDDKDSEEGLSTCRVALASVAGIQPQLAAQEAGEQLLRGLAEHAASMLSPFTPDERQAVERALQKQRVGEALSLLTPLLKREISKEGNREQATVAKRRRKVLTALIDQHEAIGKLAPKAAAIFAAAALAQAELLAMAVSQPVDSPALIALGKLLGTETSALVELSKAALVERFAAEGERKMRQVAGILANEAVYGGEILQRLIEALVEAGGASVVFGAAETAKEEAFVETAMLALVKNAALSEPVIREVLERRPLLPDPTHLALRVAGKLGTERLALVIGRRFYELRQASRFALVEAVTQLGDERLRPLLESRAYPGEVEEAGAVMLAVLAGELVEGALKERLERIERSPAPTSIGETEQELLLPLSCSRCEETLTYAVQRVFLDPKSPSADGDPVFSGDITCKACGGMDSLKSTPAATQILAESMMGDLDATRHGLQSTGRVMPRTIRVMGEDLSMAAALRKAEKMVADSPDSIRGRLVRCRLRLMLWRKSAREDAEKILSLDPRSPEGRLLIGTVLAREGKATEARDSLSEAYHVLQSETEPRIYEGDVRGVRLAVEAALLEMAERGVEMPADIDLAPARRRAEEERERQETYLARLSEEMERRQSRATPAARPAILKVLQE